MEIPEFLRHLIRSALFANYPSGDLQATMGEEYDFWYVQNLQQKAMFYGTNFWPMQTVFYFQQVKMLKTMCHDIKAGTINRIID